MSKYEWKPGDVAMVTFQAPSHGGRFGSDRSGWLEPGTFVAVAGPATHGETGVVWHSAAGSAHATRRDCVSSARPLVVIDPAQITGPDETCEADPIEEIANCLRNLALAEKADVDSGSYRGRVAARLSAHFRTYIAPAAPPKPVEPMGWLAAIEDAEQWRWFSHGSGFQRWQRTDGKRAEYEQITAVRVLSEGVAA